MVESRCVVGGPERPDGAVGVPIGLQTFEDLLPVMENRASRAHGNSFVRFDPEIMPSPLGGPCRMGHVVGEPFAEAEIDESRAALCLARRMRIGNDFPGAEQFVGEWNLSHGSEF